MQPVEAQDQSLEQPRESFGILKTLLDCLPCQSCICVCFREDSFCGKSVSPLAHEIPQCSSSLVVGSSVENTQQERYSLAMSKELLSISDGSEPPWVWGSLRTFGEFCLVLPTQAPESPWTSLIWGFIVFSVGFPLLVKAQGLAEIAWTAPCPSPRHVLDRGFYITLSPQ